MIRRQTLPRQMLPRPRAAAALFAAALFAAAGLAGLADRADATTKSEEAVRGVETAIFAGGCFWCVESDFDHVAGVGETVSGYIGGELVNPTYEQVSRENTGHREAVKITYDPKIVSYATLLDIFWHSVDPTDAGGQFCDRGYSYTTAIYTLSPAQREAALASKAALEASGALDRPVATEIAEAGPFWPAEGYHQNYYETNALQYTFYRWRCGRDAALEKLWGMDAMKGIAKAE